MTEAQAAVLLTNITIPVICFYWLLLYRSNYINLFIYLFIFSSVLRPFQDDFSSYETGQSVGGAITGEPREKPPDTPAIRAWLVSHVARAGLEPTPDTAVIIYLFQNIRFYTMIFRNA